MSKQTIVAPNAPAAIGPYCHGIKCGDMIYTSGQIPLVPGSGELVTEIKAATKQVLDNLLAIVEAGGGTKEDIIKMEIFVKDLDDFGSINEVYAEFFGDHKPTRYLVQAGNLPAGALLEAIATACTC
jgi:2-iminobutanoate/2-iminopropanoate deaminase